MPLILFSNKKKTNLNLDEHADKVVLLMHMEGLNDSTSFIDEKGHNFINLGASKIKTNRFKFGNSSFSTGSSFNGRIQANGNFRIGVSDFTVEGFYYWTSTYRSYLVDGDGNNFSMIITGGSTSTGFYPGAQEKNGSVHIPLNQWVHVAFTRQGRINKSFINGVLSNTWDSNIVNIQASLITINGYGGGDGYGMPEGSSMDEIRITKGVARYTSNFTVPTAAFTI